MNVFGLTNQKKGVPLSLITQDQYIGWRDAQTTFVQNWLTSTAFKGKGFALIPDQEGQLEQVLVVSDQAESMWALADAAKVLPAGNYQLTEEPQNLTELAVGWLLSQYEFLRYKPETKSELAKLSVPDADIYERADSIAEAVYLTRDLVNTPASDMMPQHLSAAMNELADRFNATFSEIVGDALLEQNYPTIHAVGRASVHAPRMLDMTWGDPEAPKLTLVGKGVCFDSGGLDLKPANAMRLMKKDMGGAAHVLGLASMIMSLELPVRLRVLIPAVENAVSSNAFRPGDIITTRKGLTVEIDNTDAEGRLVLCDALAEAVEEKPDIIIDFATLTGAARVALGLEVPVFYATDDAVADELAMSSKDVEDAIWRLPLHQPYNSFLKGSISDLVNATSTPFGGSITAALYLQHFVGDANWVHFDVGAWNDRARPGRPKGGEAMGIRAVFSLLEKRYSAL